MSDFKDILRSDAENIYTGAISACLPESAVAEAMRDFSLPKGKLILVAIGKAAYKMAKKAYETVTCKLCGKIDAGVIIT